LAQSTEAPKQAFHLVPRLLPSSMLLLDTNDYDVRLMASNDIDSENGIAEVFVSTRAV